MKTPFRHCLRLIVSLAFIAVPAFAADLGASAPTGASGKPFNPDLSANFLGLGQGGSLYPSDRTAVTHNGFELQEAELQLMSDVDPYFRANVLLSISPNTSGSFDIDPEEIFFESTTVPGVTIKAGKFKAAVGRHNQMHTHAYPFIDAPLINQELLGPEGLNDAGASASTLLPAPWYMELTVQGIGTSNQNLYGTTSSGNVAGVAQVKNLWDLSDEATLESNLFGTMGKDVYNNMGSMLGTDLTIKWRPLEGGKYRAIWFTLEYMDGYRRGAPGVSQTLGDNKVPALPNLGGIAGWVQYQFAERWWGQIRAERTGIPASAGFADENKQSALLGFFPSEFSGFRIQYDHYQAGSGPTAYNIAFQTNISIGAHPAHAY